MSIGPCIRAVVAILLLPAVVATAAFADRLHLEGGGVVDTPRWWIEGDWLYYQGDGGTVGLPRSMVARIDEQNGGPPPPAAASTSRNAASDRDRTETRRSRAGVPDDGLRSASEALKRGEYEEASRAFWDLLEDRPESLDARIGYVLAEMALERDGMALNVVLDGLARHQDQPALLELLGDLRNRDERVEDALRNWMRAAKIAPSERLANKIAKAKREMAAGGDYDLATTSHFTVRYDGDVDRTLAGEVMDYLEEQYLELTSLLRHGPPQPITVLLYSQQEFRDVTLSPDWVGGLYDGKIRVPLAGLDRLHSRAEAVLRHELTHAFVHSKTRGHCPRWLHEGLAQIVEGRTLSRAQRARLGRAAAPGGDQSGDFSYPAALDLTRFLEARRGLHAVVWVLDLLGDGVPLDAALRETFGLDEAGLRRAWVEGLGEATR